MKMRDRLIDVELTNRCNALCSFCPRDVTPEQGFMSFETFSKVIERANELDIVPRITLTGQGESTLHPQLLEEVTLLQMLQDLLVTPPPVATDDPLSTTILIAFPTLYPCCFRLLLDG